MQRTACLFCSHDNPDDARFCNNCGSPLDWQRCPRCGGVDKRTASQCHRCGHRYASADAGDVPAEADAPGPDPASAPKREMTEEHARADRLAASLRDRLMQSKEPLPFRMSPNTVPPTLPPVSATTGVDRRDDAPSPLTEAVAVAKAPEPRASPRPEPPGPAAARVAPVSTAPADPTTRPPAEGVFAHKTAAPPASRPRTWIAAAIAAAVAALALALAFLSARDEPSVAPPGDTPSSTAPISSSPPPEEATGPGADTTNARPTTAVPADAAPPPAPPDVATPEPSSAPVPAPAEPRAANPETSRATPPAAPKAPVAVPPRTSAPAQAARPPIAAPRAPSPPRECSPEIATLGLCTMNDTKREQ